MKTKILKLKFSSNVHFGDGGLTKAQSTFRADTLYSALCIEALGQGSLEKLKELCEGRKVQISDALPFIRDKFYVPKPMIHIEIKNDSDEGNSVKKKAVKALKYIPIDQFKKYLAGEMDVIEEEKYFHDGFAKSLLTHKVSISRGNGENKLYAVAGYRYREDSGLYVLVAYEEEKDFQFMRELFDSLSYTGIGGKVSVGYGRFEVEEANLPKEFKDLFNIESYEQVMTLSVSLPKDEELNVALEDAGYTLVKRGGFIASTNYADAYHKKNDLYMIEAGASFKQKFAGDIYDVSAGGKHSVYRYGIPFFMGVK